MSGLKNWLIIKLTTAELLNKILVYVRTPPHSPLSFFPSITQPVWLRSILLFKNLFLEVDLFWPVPMQYIWSWILYHDCGLPISSPNRPLFNDCKVWLLILNSKTSFCRSLFRFVEKANADWKVKLLC